MPSGGSATHVFRPAKTTGRLGLVFGIIFAAAALASLIGPWTRFRGDPHAVELAIAGGVVYGTMFLLSCYLVASVRRHELRIEGDTIAITGVFHSRAMPVREIAAVKWRGWPQLGSVVLRGRSKRLAISFTDYEPGRRAEIVELLRARTGTSIQQGWEAFSAPRRSRTPQETTRLIARSCIVAAVLAAAASVSLDYASAPQRGPIGATGVIFAAYAIGASLWGVLRYRVRLMAVAFAIAVPVAAAWVYLLAREIITR